MKTKTTALFTDQQLDIDSTSVLGWQVTYAIDPATRCVVACHVGRPSEKDCIERFFASLACTRSGR
ncbi:hypothetical protein [Rhizobium flavescens]|uniref:hypothetical protein n=1 Tax=Rhizobium flavescens TaxID=2607407 RepID=UPI001408BA17|nr:hypothetical protein [Rhizobium flavescens]